MPRGTALGALGRRAVMALVLQGLHPRRRQQHGTVAMGVLYMNLLGPGRGPHLEVAAVEAARGSGRSKTPVLALASGPADLWTRGPECPRS